MLLILLLAILGAHRIVNYEDLFAGWRAWATQRAWLKPVWCQHCNPVWIATLLVIVALRLPAPWCSVILWPLAAYLPVRIVAAWSGVLLREQVALPQWPAPMATVTLPRPSPPPVPAACNTCGTSNIAEEHERNRTFDRRFVLFTWFADFHPSYSLTTAVIDQARILARDPRHLVQIWVLSVCNMNDAPTDLPPNVLIKRVVTPIPIPADVVDPKAAEILAGQLMPHLMVLGNATIITHDLLFVNSYVSVAATIHDHLGKVPGFQWFHTCHSAPAAQRPDQITAARYRSSLPEGHTLLGLAAAQQEDLARYYGTTLERVRVAPNARDLRSLLHASADVHALIERHGLFDADIVQIFPLSTPRAEAKGVPTVVRIFAELAKTQTVRLVIANAHANGNEGMITSLKGVAAAAGLPAEALVFVSESLPQRATYGLTQDELHVLFQCSNLFIFPSISEACSMTLMEAALNGCLLILNDSLPSLFDIIPRQYCLAFPWGSVVQPVPLEARASDVDIARTVRNIIRHDITQISKRSILRTHNLGAVERLLLAALA